MVLKSSVRLSEQNQHIVYHVNILRKSAKEISLYQWWSFSYDCLIEANELENRVVADKTDYTPVYHLNTINSMHSEWKRLWEFYRGVSTKYLNRYLALFTFMREYMGMDRQEQYQDIQQRLNKVIMVIPVRIVKGFNLLTI